MRKPPCDRLIPANSLFFLMCFRLWPGFVRGASRGHDDSNSDRRPIFGVQVDCYPRPWCSRRRSARPMATAYTARRLHIYLGMRHTALNARQRYDAPGPYSRPMTISEAQQTQQRRGRLIMNTVGLVPVAIFFVTVFTGVAEHSHCEGSRRQERLSVH